MKLSRMRPEARPLKLDVLDHYQKEAIELISAVLLEALEDLKQIPSSDRGKGLGGNLDAHRASRLFFLSGEAGGGKTTVYLSLRNFLENESSNPAAGGSLLKLQAHARQLIWLDPLDLEPAPEAGNFLAATLVRIEDALERHGHSVLRDDRRRSLLEREPKDALQELQNLRNDVVLAWEGNVAQRAAKTEPDVYSLEVLHAARASLHVNARLQRALEDMLAEDQGERRLFILPVDDLYLRPSSSLELLRFLRMISVPRLFILMMGDLFIAEELFYQDMLGRLAKLAGEQVFRDFPRQKMTLTSTATSLTAHSMRKLIPAAQQYRLIVMHRLGALKFHPAKLDPSASYEVRHDPKAEDLAWILERLPVSLPLMNPLPPVDAKKAGKVENLLQFLRLRKPEDETENDDYYTYSGLQVLDLPPREVVDLWYCMKHVPREWESTLNVRVESALASISGQTYLSKEDQEFCSEALQGPRGFKRVFLPDPLRVEPDHVSLLKLPLDGETWDYLITSFHRGWFFYPRRPDATDRDFMAPRPTAWLTVLHDLMALSGEDRLAGEPLTPKPFDFKLVRVRSADCEIGWPTPQWISFRHFDRLSFAWRKVVKKAKGRKGKADFLEWLAFYWMRYIADILLANGNELRVEPGEIGKRQWSALAQDLERLRLADRAEPEAREMIHDWLIRLNILLSSELALPESIKDREDRLASVLKPFWQEKDKEIQQVRAEIQAKRSKKADENPAS